MKKIKIVGLMIGLLVVSALTFVGVANAQSFKAGDSIGVAADETINSMLFIGGNNIDIAGTVNGDVYCGGQTVTISGQVNGDVFCAGETVIVSGKINGSVRLAGQNVTISGVVTRSATVGSQNLVVNKDAVIGQDLLGGGQNVTINGKVSRDVTTGADALTINGLVGRDINGALGSISIGSSGKVSGTVDYTGKTEPSIASGGKIVGTVTRTEPRSGQRFQLNPGAAIGIAIGSFVFFLMATIIFALVLAGMFPKVLEDSAISTMKSPGRTVLTGLIALIVAPVLITVLFVTIVGAPIGIFALLSWLIIMLVSGSFSAYLLGKLIMKKSKNTLLVMLVGISITTVTLLIPFINFIVFLAISMFGVGAVLIQSKKLFRRPAIK